MSELVPSVVPLDHGLDLKSPKLTAPRGSLLDVLNYEQAEVNGQSRVLGYTRYDGSAIPALDEYTVLEVSSDAEVAPGDLLTIGGNVSAVALASGEGKVYITPLNHNNLPRIGEDLSVFGGGSFSVSAMYDGREEEGITPETHYENLLSFTNVLRSRVESLPGPVAGLHWFNDRLYSVASVTAVSVDASATIYPNDELEAFGETVKVLDVIDGTLYLSSTRSDVWSQEGEPILRDGVEVATTAGPAPEGHEMASFFDSRTEQQVLQEDQGGPYDFGWRFRDLGWKVLFENGISLYGSLPALNANRESSPITGPTNIDGGNGRPLSVYQNVPISGLPRQVNGWKDSSTPSSYNIDASALANTDEHYIYADAYFSWHTDGSVSQEISSLRTLPANNSVEVIL